MLSGFIEVCVAARFAIRIARTPADEEGLKDI